MMNYKIGMASVLAVSSIVSTQAAEPVQPSGTEAWPSWPSEPPADCPIAKSETLIELVFTDRHAEYTKADTWYPTWASNGNMYSPWTDGVVNGLRSDSADKRTYPEATTGHATIIGDDPLHLKIEDHALHTSAAAPYQGRYPAGSLVYNGVWYYGTYCLSGGQIKKHKGVTYNWPWLGPFVGFRYSKDFGKTWTETPCTPEKPLFGEHSLKGEPVKIGAPHFVDFGKNMEHSPDGKAYLVAHGASDGMNRRFGYNSWITGDEVYLLRVTPTIENMNDPTKYEFFDGTRWTHDFGKIKPIVSWRDKMGCVTMTYNAPLRKYLMCVTDGMTTGRRYNTYILESDTMTGPFKMVHYLKEFGEQGYFVNFPSKFISKDGKTLWLSYSGNFATNWDGHKVKKNPPSSRYALCLQEVKLTSGTHHIESALPNKN